MATAGGGGKLEISTTAPHPAEEIASILSDYTSRRLVSHRKLFGGYSGSNYRVDLDDGSAFVLKITNGYSAEHAELMCRTAHHLGSEGSYSDCCLPIPKQQQQDGDGSFRFVSTKEKQGVPAFLLTYTEGKQADAVMRERPDLAATVMRGIGGGLARMHVAGTITTQKEAKRLGIRWYQTDGGCCDVQDQIDGKILTAILAGCKDLTKRDGFLNTCYHKELASLRDEMKLATDAQLEHGICHGDPFADNVLVCPDTGKLSALVDIEDFCAGPLLFDLCCCAIGCCFKPNNADEKNAHPQVLDTDLLRALLEGYGADRKIPEIELDRFVAFMRLTLLCNCSWRFVKFNVGDGDFPEEAKNSYLELQHRIEYLHDPGVVEQINRLLLQSSSAESI